MAVMSIMMMFSFAAAAKCTGTSTTCVPTVCCMGGKQLEVFGACDVADASADEALCRTCSDNVEVEGFAAAGTCTEFAALNEVVKVNLSEALINSTTAFANMENMTTMLTRDQLIAAAMKSIMSPEEHLAVAKFQRGEFSCNNSTAAENEGTEEDDGTCPSATCCGVPTLSSCMEGDKCDCKSFCMENQTEIIAAYATVTNLSAIIVLQQKELMFVNGDDMKNRDALLEGLSEDQKKMLMDKNPFFGNAATLGSFALVLAVVMNF